MTDWDANEDNWTEARRLQVLHDRLRYTLEDVTGRFFHEDQFERVFDHAIAEAESREVKRD